LSTAQRTSVSDSGKNASAPKKGEADQAGGGNRRRQTATGVQRAGRQ